ncbi:hypothetical protein DUI87_02091 [Hirundo rustica rustica]|uniref:Gag-Pol polyprotein n=1 Tax=Hirundo rustica rustica TaxID=333673 RepID=A0A3M0L7D3_HIRRU|nr:hypothetical protein DUI87_02091 [Hirundo rustica rustica]
MVVIGAKGEPFKVPIVKNVEIESENKICLGDMLLVEEADYNLLGRDLMVALGINLIIRNSQITVSIYKLTCEDEDKINPKVWHTGKEAGKLAMEPISIEIEKPEDPIRIRQYPIPLEGRRGLKPIIEDLIRKGILEPCMSRHNTPILAVKKGDGNYRLVQDLRAINERTRTRFPVVANPYTLLNRISPKDTWYSVIDLKDAFWTCPLAEGSRDFFAFQWEDPDTNRKQQLRKGTKILQYVDDLLVAGETEEGVRECTIDLLNFLGEKGLKAIVAVALLVEEAKKITFGAPITVYTPHNVRTILQQKAEKWLTDARLLKYEAILLHAPELELRTTQASNPAGFLFGEASSEPIHNCIDLVELQTKIREDLEDEELEEGEKWFVDGSARVIEGKRKSGYAIIDGKTGEVIKSGPLGTSWSAQACELYAVLQALKGLKGKIGTIFTDSKYAFGVVHTFGKIWEERGLVNTRGKGLIHEDLIRQILKAVREPKAIAVVYVKSHQAGLQFRIRGNNLADQEARKAALLTLDTPESRTEKFGEVSPHPTEKEIEDFKKMGGNLINGKWKLTDGRELIPKAYARIILKRLHAQTHWGTQALAEQFLKFFGCKGLSPFEMLYGMPYEHGMPVGHPRVEDCQIQSYIVVINKNLQELRKRGLIAQSTPLGFAIHKIQPGDRVLIRAWKEAPLSSHWEGPFLVLLTTDTAVRTAEKGWTHCSRVKKVEQHSSSPQWKITSAPGDLKLRIHRDTQ